MARFINIHVAYVLLLLGAPSLAACTATAGNEPGAAAADIDDFRIDALSAKPHLVSGGDLLVRISMPPESVGVSDLAVTVDDRDLSAAFRPEDGREALLGIVDRLPLGDSQIVDGGARGADVWPVALTTMKLGVPTRSQLEPPPPLAARDGSATEGRLRQRLEPL